MSSGWSNITLPKITGFGTGNFFGTVTFPLLTIEATGGSNSGIGGITLPVVTITSYGYSKGAVLLPALTASGNGIIGVVGNSGVVLPSFIVSGKSGAVASVKLKALTINATGYSDVLGTSSINLPVLLLTANGTVNIAGTGAVSLRKLTGYGTGFTGEVGSASISIPVFTASASGGITPVGIADIILPVLTVLGAGTVTETILAVVTELTNFAFSEYTNYSFNSMCKFGSVHLGCTNAGIFNLENNTDAESSIDAYFELPISDFDIPNQKRVRKIYFGGKADGELKLLINYDERDVQEYIVDFWREDQLLTGVKTAINRSSKGRYLSFKVENISGSNFTIDKIDVAVTALTKKPRKEYNFGRIILPLLTAVGNE